MLEVPAAGQGRAMLRTVHGLADWNAGARGETPMQRADRAYGEILQEVRVAQTGVQILFAFLLVLAFQARQPGSRLRTSIPILAYPRTTERSRAVSIISAACMRRALPPVVPLTPRLSGRIC